MADPIAEAFVRLRADDTGLRADIQRSITRAVSGASIPRGTQRGVAQQLLGAGFVDEFGQVIQTVPRTATVPDATQRTLAQKLFGPGFRNESGRAIQGALVGLGGGQLAAQFAFFGAGGAGLAILAGGFITAAKSAVTFEQELEILRATTQATDDDLRRAGEAAEELGGRLDLPTVTAQSAAQAITELAKAGLSMDDAIAGAEGTLRLAIAAQVDTGTAARIAASGLNAFGLEGTDAAKVADLLAGASIAAQGDITDMALSLQQSAAVADQAGLSIEQLVGLITLLARQGILGSDAGTSIRTMLLRLVPTTKEASAEMLRLGIQLDETRTIGEQLPEVIEQYSRALSFLTPIQRQAALQQIFGTDAIRSATVAFQAGAAGLDAATDAANRQNAAAELTEARARKAAGAFADLTSEGQEFALNAGQVVLPAITELVGGLALLVQGANFAADAMDGALDVDLGPLGTLRDRVSDLSKVWVVSRFSSLPAAAALVAYRKATDDAGDAAEESASAIERMVNAVRDSAGTLGFDLQGIAQQFRLADTLGITQAELQRIARVARQAGVDAGFELGQALMDGVAGGITESEQAAIDAAQRSLDDIRRDGERRILESIRSARSNLESLGDTLADALGEIIDAGPIGEQIDKVNEELDALEERTSRRSLRFDLSQAERELGKMQKALTTIGVITPEQRRNQAEFLAPFKEKVDDAKSKIKEFTLEEAIEEQERLRDAAKEAAEEGLQKLIDDFEEGRLSADRFTDLLNARLGPALDIIERENLGLSFERGFLRDVEALVAQVKELESFVGTPGTTPGVAPISPAATAQEVNRALADATARLAAATEAANVLTKDEGDKLDRQIALLRKIVGRLGGSTKQTSPQSPDRVPRSGG